MAKITHLAAEPRERVGKGAARATRRAGRVPAVIYGNKKDPVSISLDPGDLTRELKSVAFFSHVFEIDVKGDKYKVLARDLQTDPVTDLPLHVDFMRFGPRTRLAVEVYCEFVNEEECPGLKKGGVLNIVRHAIELRCKPDEIPDIITVDLTGYEIGDSIHISQVSLPDNVELTITDRDFTIATIAAPTVYVEEEEEGEGEEAEAAAEGEQAEGEGSEEGDGAEESEGGEGEDKGE